MLSNNIPDSDEFLLGLLPRISDREANNFVKTLSTGTLNTFQKPKLSRWLLHKYNQDKAKYSKDRYGT